MWRFPAAGRAGAGTVPARARSTAGSRTCLSSTSTRGRPPHRRLLPGGRGAAAAAGGRRPRRAAEDLGRQGPAALRADQRPDRRAGQRAAKDFAERLERDLPRLVVSRMTKSAAHRQGPHRLVAEQRGQDHGRALLAARPGPPHRFHPGHLGRGGRLPARRGPVLHRHRRAGPGRGARRPVRPARRAYAGRRPEADLAAALGHQQQGVGGQGGSSTMRPSRTIASNPSLLTHACRRPSSSGSRSGSPWVSSVASQCWPYWLDDAVAGRRARRAGSAAPARSPVSWASSSPRQLFRRARLAGGKPPCGNDQARRPSG